MAMTGKAAPPIVSTSSVSSVSVMSIDPPIEPIGILVPFSRRTAITPLREQVPVLAAMAFQVLCGAPMLPSSPGCWMARNNVRLSGVKNGPVISAPSGAEHSALM